MSKPNQDSCPVCGQIPVVDRVPSMVDGYSIACERCGTFRLPGILMRTVLKGQDSDSDTKGLLPYLSAYIRQATERRDKVVLNENNWREFALAHRDTPISAKLTKLLELIAARSKPAGKEVPFDKNTDGPLVDAADSTEFSYLLDQLGELGYIKRALGSFKYVLKARGWEQLQSNLTRGTPGKCFVAMSFHDSMKEAYETGIYRAIKEDCKMEPVRIDLVQHNEKICDKIIAEIRTCQFLVADVTLQRAGVYFEAGFAKGLGRDVIWTCREDDLKNVHFDTRQYSHIVWESPQDLRAKLADRIKATIPSGG